MTGLVATAEIEIKAPATRIWEALVDPAQIKKYFFGSQVLTDWQPGSPIVWKGEYEGKRYEDKGEILEVEPNRRLKMTHFSPLTGKKDEPANYHTMTYDLEDRGDTTHVSLTQDNNANDVEVKNSTANWETMLSGLKDFIEGA